MLKLSKIRNLVYRITLNLSKFIPQVKLLIKSQRDIILRLPVDPGNNWHENFIVHLASILRPKVYVELGLYRCELFNRVAPFAHRSIGVDLSSESGKFMTKSPKSEFVCKSTDEYAKIARKNNLLIDLLFIDANHSKESVRKDFESFFPLVSDNGVILFHDGYPKNKIFTDSGYCGDGYKAIEQLTKDAKDYEMMTIPVHPGLTLCRKRTKHLLWE